MEFRRILGYARHNDGSNLYVLVTSTVDDYLDSSGVALDIHHVALESAWKLGLLLGWSQHSILDGGVCLLYPQD